MVSLGVDVDDVQDSEAMVAATTLFIKVTKKFCENKGFDSALKIMFHHNTMEKMKSASYEEGLFE